MMYSDDDSKGAFANTADDADDDASWAYETYIHSFKSFICPSTKNFIRTNLWRNPQTLAVHVYDLTYYAGSKFQVPGSSYEIFGFWGYSSYGSERPVSQRAEDPRKRPKLEVSLEIKPLSLR